MRKLLVLLSFVSLAPAQNAPANPQLASTKAFYDLVRGNILKSADRMPEDKYNYQPVNTVRTYGQLLMHVADGQYFICGTAKQGKPENRGIEKSALKTRAEIVKALNDAFAYCDSVYAELTDASSAATVNFFGQPRTKLSMLAFNTAHTFEHYGNIVTYLRMNGLVPPSSDPPPAPAGPAKPSAPPAPTKKE